MKKTRPPAMTVAYRECMEFSLNQTTDVLTRTPRVLRAMLDGIGDAWVITNYGPDTFSPFDVIGHLIHGEQTDWIPRARIILDHGEARPFKPFDRYAQFEESQGKTIADLLDEFERLRDENVRILTDWALTLPQLERPGTHPALGTVTLGQLLATWTVHDLHHVAQICKSMSYQYRDAVGPWKAYLGIIPASPAAE